MGNLGLEIMTAPINQFTQNDLFLYGLAGIYRISDPASSTAQAQDRSATTSS